MTREEITNSKAYQVSKAALEYYNEHHQDKDIDLTDAFEAGFEYANEVNGKELLYVAQKTAERTRKEDIKKAFEWLENNVNNYIIIDDYLGKVQPKISSSMFDDFKKVMEE